MRMMRFKKPRYRPLGREAFTLVELLVVITIIGILIGLSFPAISGALARARYAAAMSDLRQIGVAFHLYASDNENKFPYCYDSETSQTYADFVKDYLPQEIKSPTDNIFVSPAAEERIAPGDYTIAITYSAHPRVCNEKLPVDMRVPLHQITEPSRLIILVDAPQVPSNNNQSTANFWNPWQVFHPEMVPDRNALIPVGPDKDADEAQGWFRYRNNGRAHALMADGSVQSFEKGTIAFYNLVWEP